MKTIEKIELGLYEIARECRTIDRVVTSQEALNAIHEAYDRAQCMSFTGNVMDLSTTSFMDARPRMTLKRRVKYE